MEVQAQLGPLTQRKTSIKFIKLQKKEEGKRLTNKKIRLFSNTSSMTCALMLKVTKDSQLVMTDFESAEYVYVSSKPSNIQGQFIMTSNVFGVSMQTFVIATGGIAIIYALVDQQYKSNIVEPMTVMTRHFSGLYSSINFDDPLDLSQLFRDRLPDHSVRPKVNLDQMEALKDSKISAHHHLHYMPSEIYKVLTDRERKLVETVVSLPDDATRTMAAGVILWFVSLSSEMQGNILRCGAFKARTTAEFALVGKSVSVEAKSLQNMVTQDLRHIFEFDVLVNRIEGDVDWHTEKLHRENGNYANIPAAEIYSAARRVFAEARLSGRSPMNMTWEKYWASRWQWSAAGSTHSQYSEDMDYVMRHDVRLKNKFITISNMPKVAIDHFTDRVPQIHAWASTKYEWGKQRAIYGTDLTSYVLAHFAFYNCEEVLPRQFPVGPDANDANVVNRVAGVLNEKMPFCLDFEDFNSQHSAKSMESVILAYGDEFMGELSQQQQAAISWTAQSVSEQVINDNVGLHTTYKTDGSLLSGWRLTTFVNSVLNYIYTCKIAEEQRRPGTSLHNGDDVLIGTDNLRCAQKCASNALRYNVRLQSTKCAFGAIAEFLRVDHRRGSKGQYLTRAIATTMHSRIESQMSTDARDLINAMETRYSDLHARGLSLDRIRGLRSVYYARQSVVCEISVADMLTIKTSHRVVGGIASDIDAPTDNLITPGLTRAVPVEISSLPAIQDYAELLKSVLNFEVSVRKLMSRLERATLEAVTEKARSMRVVPNSDSWYQRVKWIYKAHKGTISVANYGKAALVGMTIDALRASTKDSSLMRVINNSHRPEELLKHLV